MRSIPLPLLALPLLATATIFMSTSPKAVHEDLPPRPSAQIEVEALSLNELRGTSSRDIARPQDLHEEDASPAIMEVSTTQHLVPPSLPVNPLFEEDATKERYAEWYRGTATEHLCQSLVRINALRMWDPKTCCCMNSKLLFKRTAKHQEAHSLHEQTELLLQEELWLTEELQRHVKADLESGGSLPPFRLPQTKELLTKAIAEKSREEVWILQHLLDAAKAETRSLAIEEELREGRFTVSKQSPPVLF